MLKALMLGISGLVVLAAALLFYGAYRWKNGTQRLRALLDSLRRPIQPRVVDFRELEGLPAPVQRYFRAVLKDGQRMVTTVNVQHTGSFNMSESTPQWKPFTSNQRVVAHRPGFAWDARIIMLPGLAVRVHDAYVAGEGILHASLLGLYSLAQLRGTGAMAEGELMRFFAEAAWYPTVLLPSQGVRWTPMDDGSAYAALSDGGISITMLFTFNEQNLIDTVRTEARGRTIGNKVVPTPWQARCWNYADRGGMLVPLDGEAAWRLPEGEKPYWRGHTSGIVYEFTD